MNDEAPTVAVLEPSDALRRHFETLVQEYGFRLWRDGEERGAQIILLADDVGPEHELRRQARAMVAAGARVITIAFPETKASGLVLRRPFSPAALRRSLRAAAGESGVTWPHPDTSAPRVVVDAEALQAPAVRVPEPVEPDAAALALLRHFAERWAEADAETRTRLCRDVLRELREQFGSTS